MDGDFKLTRRARIGWLTGMAVILTIALVVVFGLTSSSLVEGQASSLAKQYTDPELDGASSPCWRGTQGSTIVPVFSGLSPFFCPHLCLHLFSPFLSSLVLR